MVDVQSKELIDNVSDDLKVQPAMQIPRALGKDIQLVYNVNPKNIIHLVRSQSKSTSGTATLFTPVAGKRFFITSATMAWQCDATSTNTTLQITGTPIGQASVSLMIIAKLSATALDGTNSVTFDPPVEMEPLVNITVGSSFGAGASTVSATITGYETIPQ